MLKSRFIFPALFIFSLILIACKKNGSGESELVTPKKSVKFKVEPSSSDPDFTIYTPGVEVRFTNTSDSDINISYRWQFGDGEMVTGDQASHAYAQPGNYTVWLTKYQGNLAVDSASNTVRIWGTPRVIQRSAQYDSYQTKIACYGDKIYLTGWLTESDDHSISYRQSYITQYDTLWREQWTKVFDWESAAVNIAGNGDLLVSNAKATVRGWETKVSRMDANGNIKWTWNSSATDVVIRFANEDKSGNIILMGEGNVNSVAIQLDASGIERWNYAWPGVRTMMDCFKLVTVNDGYIIAGHKREPYVGSGDSAHVAKLSLDGKLVWATVVPWQDAIATFKMVFTVLDQSNKLQVVSHGSSNYYTFDLNGKFLGYHALGGSVSPNDVLINKTGSMLVLTDTLMSPQVPLRNKVVEIKPDGSIGWTSNIRQTIDHLNIPSLDSTSGSTMALTNDNYVLVSGAVKYTPAGASKPVKAAFITHVNANGKLN